MDSRFQWALLPRAAGGLALIIAGALGLALTAPDSWIGLAALLADFGGLALMYAATLVWMERFGGRVRLAAAAARRPRHGCGIALLRFFLIAVTAVAACFWLWCAVVDLNEIRLLVFGGRAAAAQIIGRDIVAAGAPVGYVDYAYRTSSTVAPANRFAVLPANYPRYRMGQRFDVTYSGSFPQVHRIGRVDWLYGLRRLLYWLLIFANGAAYLCLPLWLLEFRRQPPGPAPRSLANPIPPSK